MVDRSQNTIKILYMKDGWIIPPEKDAEFVAQMEKVLDVFKRSYDQRFSVVCMDESPRRPGTPRHAESSALTESQIAYTIR